MVSEDPSEKVTRLMAALNRDSARIMVDFDVSACTDVTGFGLLGHLAEMVDGSGCSAKIVSRRVPIIPEAVDFAAMGLIPAGAYKNREFRERKITFSERVPRTLRDLLFDPQTSGGLLISVSDAHCTDLISALRDEGIADASPNFSSALCLLILAGTLTAEPMYSLLLPDILILKIPVGCLDSL